MLAGGASIQWSRRFASPDGTLVKLSEVARHADVSPSTVSYVLSGKRSISEQTRRRVLDSIATLGYGPHADRRRGGDHGPRLRARRPAAHPGGGRHGPAAGRGRLAGGRDHRDGRGGPRRAAGGAPAPAAG